MDVERSGVRQRASTIALIVGFFVFYIFNSQYAYASCGFEDSDLKQDATDFSTSSPGSLILKIGPKYVVLRRDRCAKFRSIDTNLHFFVNHLSLTPSSEPAFLAVHAALINSSDLSSIIYLFRNRKGNGTWAEDQSSADYSSTHSVPHSEFNEDLNLPREKFDAKYHNGARKWNDSIQGPGSVTYSTWDTASNFRVSSDIVNALQRGSIGLRTQNYFIRFDTSEGTSLENAPDFSMQAGGSKCIDIRISGSGNISAIVSGEYIVALNGTDTCDTVISQLRGIGILEWIFGYRN